jgi:hypothetical protein
VIERHCPPTKFDIKPYGTLLKVFCDNGEIEYYIQIGDEDITNWKPVMHLLDSRFKDLYEDQEFMVELLRQFQDCERSIMFFTDILKSKL